MDSLFNRLAERGALPSAISVTPLATLRVDLTPDTDEILARMNKYTRRNISRAERKNLSCRLGQESDITAFNALAKIHGRRCGYTFFPDDYYYNLWSTLAPKGHFCFFVAEYQGQIIAANSYIIFGDTILDYHLVDNGLHKELNAATLLQWEGMLWGKKHGCSWYDFGGIKMLPARALMNNRPLPDTREGRLAKFKKSFGSQLMLRPGVFDVSLVPPKRLTVLLVPSLIKMKPLLNFLLGHSLSGFVRMHDKAIREEAALLDL
jgi:lipid II:glycine glycyltransferase (peptidoglycan interpeptide bridge formation enzyme)